MDNLDIKSDLLEIFNAENLNDKYVKTTFLQKVLINSRI
jgi:hypothetical protein